MSGTATAISELNEPSTAEQPPRPAALPYLAVANARAALAWYADAFDAVVMGDPIVMDDGRIGHAEIAIGDGVLYLADEYPELGLKAPAPGAVSVSLMAPDPGSSYLPMSPARRQRLATIPSSSGARRKAFR